MDVMTCKQRSFRRACTSAQSRQKLCCLPEVSSRSTASKSKQQSFWRDCADAEALLFAYVRRPIFLRRGSFGYRSGCLSETVQADANFHGWDHALHSVSKSFVVCLSMKRPSDISICSECSGETTHQNSVFRSFAVCLLIGALSRPGDQMQGSFFSIR